jgi:hypothetical protein
MKRGTAALSLRRPHVGFSRRGRIAIVVLLFAEGLLVWLHVASYARVPKIIFVGEQFIPDKGWCFDQCAVVETGDLYVELGPRGIFEYGEEFGYWRLLSVRVYERGVRIHCSLFVLHGVMLLVAAILLARAWRRRAPLPGHCTQCDYDLQGLVEPRCPECGVRFDGIGKQDSDGGKGPRERSAGKGSVAMFKNTSIRHYKEP